MASNDIFSSVVSDIKSYSGKDPLLPWLRGVRRMNESLPSNVLKKKLPRFLQKCCKTFESDRRYRDDLRYLRIWLHLMDYVNDPMTLLRTMEEKRIGTTRSLFYQAYALYYEKLKKFDEAEKMYHLGVEKHAEPADELQKSYEQFLQRMMRQESRRIRQQKRGTVNNHGSLRSISNSCPEVNDENLCGAEVASEVRSDKEALPDSERIDTATSTTAIRGREEPEMPCGDDTIVVKFVKTAVFGKSEAEDACHHGLVEPTINTKEALNAINSMFCEPLETVSFAKRSHKSHPKKNTNQGEEIQVFIDDNLDNRTEISKQKEKKEFPEMHQSGKGQKRHYLKPLQIFVEDDTCGEIGTINQEKDYLELRKQKESKGFPLVWQNGTQNHQPLQETLEIYVDEEASGEIHNINGDMDSSELENQKEKEGFPVMWQSETKTFQPHLEPLQIYVDDESTTEFGNRNNGDYRGQCAIRNSAEGSTSSATSGAFVFPTPRDLPPKSYHDQVVEEVTQTKFREDTVVGRFVGSAISDEPVVENVCHHGLVEPTVNLKEAMDDINNMFGKPIDFVRTRRSKKQEKLSEKKPEPSGFSVLADDDLGQSQTHPQAEKPGQVRDSDLFETTMCTKEAMDEINRMFGMPLDL